MSDAQLRFVSNSSSGTGLLKCGSVVILFDNRISKDTDLYRLYNTNLHEKIAEGIAGQRERWIWGYAGSGRNRDGARSTGNGIAR